MKRSHIIWVLFLSIFIFSYTEEAKGDTIPNGYTKYIVNNYTEFKSAMNSSPSIKKYILLNNDVIFGFSDGKSTTSTISKIDTLYYTSDTIIDGSGVSGNNKFSLLFGYIGNTNAYSSESPLRTVTPNLSIVFKNLNFGNGTNKNFTNGGIVYPYTDLGTKLNLNLIVNNVSFNISGFNGTPFNSYYSDDNTLTFQGNNTFVSSNSTNGKFFSSGFSNIVFDSYSDTSITANSNESTELFAGTQDVGKLNITLKNNSNLTIDNGKNSLVKSSFFTLNTEDSATLNYNKKNGAFKGNIGNINSSGDTTINAGIKSRLIFSSTDKNMSSWYLSGKNNINANSPLEILFIISSSTSNSLFDGTSININRSDTLKTNDFQTSTLTNSENVTSDYKNFEIGDTKTISGETTQGKIALLYEPINSILQINTSTIIAPGQSDLNITGLTQTIPDSILTSTNYKILKKSVISEDVNTSNSQKAIENIEKSDLNLIEDKSELISPIYTINDLTSQNYYIYSQINSKYFHQNLVKEFSSISKSKWIETISNIPSSTFVQVPKDISFSSPKIGSFKTDSFDVINKGNSPVTISLSEFRKLNSKFEIVSKLEKDKPYSTSLFLNIIATSLKEPVAMNTLSLNTNLKITLPPYIESENNKATFYFTGNYTGPLNDERNGKFSLKIKIN